MDPRDAKTVYVGGNVLLKSTDGGLNWKTISPDLTRNDKSKQQLSGGPIHYDLSGAERQGWYRDQRKQHRLDLEAKAA